MRLERLVPLPFAAVLALPGLALARAMLRADAIRFSSQDALGTWTCTSTGAPALCLRPWDPVIMAVVLALALSVVIGALAGRAWLLRIAGLGAAGLAVVLAFWLAPRPGAPWMAWAEAAVFVGFLATATCVFLWAAHAIRRAARSTS